MEPIRIIAHMAGPVAYHPAEGLTIDSPLAWAVLLERYGEEFFTRSPSNDELARATADPDPDLPLAVHRAGGTWMYAASLAEPEGAHGTELVHWNKRLDDAMAMVYLERGALDLGKRTKVRTGSGEFKAYHQPLYLELVERLVWYAVGDLDKVRRLLENHVHHLGKKRHAGHGTVAAWEIEPWRGRPDRWLWRDDARTMPARAIPLAMLPAWEGETMLAGYQPPYWLMARQAVCAVPEAADRVGDDIAPRSGAA